jgi:hypothetical protein
MTIATRFGVELRAEMQGDTLRGHAAVFETRARIRNGWEDVDRHAFDAVLAARDTDVRALINHQPSMLLGRQSAGTLRLSVDSQGLPFEVDLPNTSYANDLRVLVERGDLDGASFGFVPGDDRFTRSSDGRTLRTHTSVKALLDVSAVTYPAYDGADVALRHYELSSPDGRSQLILARHRARTAGGITP